jgi:hypothetical protein
MPKCKLTRPKPCGSIAHLVESSSFVYKYFKESFSLQLKNSNYSLFYSFMISNESNTINIF